MTIGLKHLRSILALLAAVVLAAAGFAAPSSELSEDLHHAALHDASGPDHLAQVSAAIPDADAGRAQHDHPDVPGHSHCAAGCHVQMADSRVAVTVAYSVMSALFVPLTESVSPAGHLDGLFRPPRI
jgi:uncharacterized protein involved in copper resistance